MCMWVKVEYLKIIEMEMIMYLEYSLKNNRKLYSCDNDWKIYIIFIELGFNNKEIKIFKGIKYLSVSFKNCKKRTMIKLLTYRNLWNKWKNKNDRLV